jgi:hypothetical protein
MIYRNVAPFYFLLSYLCLALGSAKAQAQNTFAYTLYVEDKEVGSMSIEHQPQVDGLFIIEQHSHINTPGFWGDLDIQGTLKETHAANGALLKSDNKVKENSKTFWTRIELSFDEYLAFKTQMKNDLEQEDEETIELAKGAVAHLIPGTGDIMMVGELLFSEAEDEQINTRFTKNSFDTSFLELPYYWKNNGFTLPSSLRIFDTEEMFVFSTTITHKGKEAVNIGGIVIEANQYTLNVKENEPTEIWLALSNDHIPYFVQITGKEDGENYRIAHVTNKREKKVE